MRYFLLILSLGMVWTWQACKPKEGENQAKLQLKFRASHLGNPLITFKKYPIAQGSSDSIEHQLLNFMVSDLALVRSDGSRHSLGRTELVELSLDDQTRAEAGYVLNLTDLPLGNYTAIEIGFGLSDDLNRTEPGDHNTGTPLGDVGNYWTAWNSYIFSRLEGRLFPASGQMVPYLYHSGADGMYQLRRFELGANFELLGGQTAQLVFNLKGEDLFFNPQRPVDIVAEPVSHSGAVGTPEYLVARQTLINLSQAFSLLP